MGFVYKVLVNLTSNDDMVERQDEFCVDLSVENNITCGGGQWQSEVFWDLSDSDGTTLAAGGAPFEGCVGGACEPEIVELYEFDDNGQTREYYLQSN